MSNRSDAVTAWREELGQDSVVVDSNLLREHAQNTTSFRQRELVCVLQPRTPHEVVLLVRTARRYRVPLYPFSTGKNWGLGSKLPPTDGCALVDLRRLDRIRRVDEARHYAIVEPGVTQRQLSEYLAQQNLALMLNVTGSSPESSLVGNTLERGTGFTLHRTEDLRGVEVVLGTGELMRTGFWADESPARPTGHYRHGIGPYLDGVFAQSNFGIVTAIQLNLVPRPEALRMFMFTYEQENVPVIIDSLSQLYKDGALRWIVHMFNDKRMKAVNAQRKDTPKWTGVASAGGSLAYVQFASGALQRTLGPSCTSFHTIEEADASAADCDPIVRGLYWLHTGRPNTTFMNGLYNTLGASAPPADLDDLDKTHHGMLTCLPFYPMDGKQVLEALATVDEVCDPFGICPAVTLNPVDADGLESVINIYFDRNNENEAAAAQRCNEKLHLALLERGFRFYRVDIENIRHVVRQDSSYWRTVESLKHALDPDQIIAPKRYNLL